MVKLGKDEYEAKALLKPYSKAKNPTGVKNNTIAIIEDCTEITLAQTGKTRMLKFKEYEKALPLNKTNKAALVKLFGDDTDDWIDKEVKLIIVMANNPKGGEAASIRIKNKDWMPGDDDDE